MSITNCHQVNAGCLSPSPHITVQVEEILKVSTTQTLPLFIFSDIFVFFWMHKAMLLQYRERCDLLCLVMRKGCGAEKYECF